MPSTICSACGILFQDGKKYCRVCGAPLRLKYALLPCVVSSCESCAVQYVVDRTECPLCGQILARSVEQVVGAGFGVVAAEESPAHPRLLSQDALQTYVGSARPVPKASASVLGSAPLARPTRAQRARVQPGSPDRSADEPRRRVAWILALLLLAGLGIAGGLAGIVLVKQFGIQAEAPQLTLIEPNQAEDGRQTTKPPRSTHTKKAETHNARGVDLAGLGNIEGAIAEFRRAVAADARNFKAHNNLGVLYQQKGLVPQAISAYTAASNAEPGHPVPYKNMAILNEERSQLKKALQNYSRYLELAPNALDRETIRLKIRDLRSKMDNKPAS